MASVLFLSALEDQANGDIDFASDTFYCLLVNGYTPNAATHTKRSDVSDEVTGSGYLAGGKPVTATVSKDTGNNRVDVTFSSPSWPVSTITADGAVIYKYRGGAASADELVAFIDFGSEVTSSDGDFDVTFTTPLRFQA